MFFEECATGSECVSYKAPEITCVEVFWKQRFQLGCRSKIWLAWGDVGPVDGVCRVA